MTRRAFAPGLALVLAFGHGSAALALQGAPPPAPIDPPAHVAAGAAQDAPPSGGDADGLRETLQELSAPIQVLLVLSFLVFLPAALLTLTSYTRIIIVLSFVRKAIGAQELPPNPILIGLALFMTGAIMAPTFSRVTEQAIEPFRAGTLSMTGAAEQSAAELKTFMLRQTREDDILLALELAGRERPADQEAVPFTVMVPAFVLSELRTAFRMGFIIYLPFVLIDLVVAAVLLALGMFMLPPTMVAMPLKILLFVLVDGWSLIVQSLTASFAAPT